ncbi:D-serine ammonia-lyase [Brevibacterium jeotgali]|uniref:Probable D-serine dehydratase n=1 Tax=Brevibacterium jeotgali TaxID=1262550 RepID=A0A2H1L5P6_9MICO|nr:D-serine ammonia-lyase [Brevibacterium jeotgali]TWB98479.1 D-serine ammonia-lyase [Brevibacterium jeotgali]SMY12070.1 D-serine ammonia-lyase [Brevibacterium jeotgali]
MTDAAAVRYDLSDESRAILDAVIEARPTVWVPARTTTEKPGVTQVGDVGGARPTPALVDAAEERFRWFAPLFEQLFPETRAQGGVIESPLEKVASLSRALAAEFGEDFPANLWVKRDDALAVSGSVKSRGGIHEVLEVALGAARDLGVDLDRGPSVFLDEGTRERMSRMRIVVGSTGNLGMSIGLMGAILGFSVTVHMSLDAKAWKKETLRSSGVEVVEHDTDFTQAVHAGRAAADADPCAHFIDDENSLSLFAGYAVAGRRLAGQLAAASVVVDEENPLTVHLPCGIGGAPGGIAYGLSTVFGSAVRCVFVEPVSMPAFLLGRLTGLDDGISVADVGLGALTIADGLAVGRPSRFVGRAVGHLLHGYATVTDDDLLRTLAVAEAAAGLRLEPSACAGLRAAGQFAGHRTGSAGTHIAWLTGGSLVPDEEFAALLEAGRTLLRPR